MAAKAGVTLMGVSRTLRIPDPDSPGTRWRMAFAAQDLNYVPDADAGDLSSKRGQHVADLLHSLRQTRLLPTVDDLSDALRAHAHRLSIGNCYPTVGQLSDLLRRSNIPVLETRHRAQNSTDRVDGSSRKTAALTLRKFTLGGTPETAFRLSGFEITKQAQTNSRTCAVKTPGCIQ